MKPSETGRHGVFQSVLIRAMDYFAHRRVVTPDAGMQVVPLPFTVTVTAATLDKKNMKPVWLPKAQVDVKRKTQAIDHEHEVQAQDIAWAEYIRLERGVRRTCPGNRRLVAVMFEFSLRDGKVVLARPVRQEDMFIHGIPVGQAA